METIIWIGIGIVGLGSFLLAKQWITIYNKFIYWKNKLDERFAGIDIIMQRRIDMLPALAQVAKKYSIHEYKIIKDTIEARSKWTKDKSLNEKTEAVDEIENNFIKIQTLFERYPKVKADKLYRQIMGHGNISNIERKLQQFRLTYNKVVRDYNERVERFPRNIVAKVHGFKTANYLTLGNKINQEQQEEYNPKELFNE
ncbi:LemA family protein [Candidatus Woesearchaeota archaeon]|nr:MAG: LemA protein [archaeon GW2011_AR18]MBS3161990.1 LemA family protein [Candidatus Woesearchaeota archaeon]HIH25851.1 LemA family protein [Nanoarchaeota archaeon]